jgi:hypothetical protein
VNINGRGLVVWRPAHVIRCSTRTRIEVLIRKRCFLLAEDNHRVVNAQIEAL